MITKSEIEKYKLCHISRKLSYNEAIEFYEHGFDFIKEGKERRLIKKVTSNFFVSYSSSVDDNELIVSFKKPFYYIYDKLLVTSDIGKFIVKAIKKLNQKSRFEIFLLQRRLYSRHEPFSKKTTLFEHIIHGICDSLRYSNEKIIVNSNYKDSSLLEIEIILEIDDKLISKTRTERKQLHDYYEKINKTYNKS